MNSREHAHCVQHLAACKPPVRDQNTAMTVCFIAPFNSQAPQHHVALCPLLAFKALSIAQPK